MGPQSTDRDFAHIGQKWVDTVGEEKHPWNENPCLLLSSQHGKAYRRWCTGFPAIQGYCAPSNGTESDRRHAPPSCEADNTNAHPPIEWSKQWRTDKIGRVSLAMLTTISGMMMAQTKSSHVGKTFFSGGGWYRLRSEQRNDRRTGLTRYFRSSQLRKTIINETVSKINFKNETGCRTGWRLERTDRSWSSELLTRGILSRDEVPATIDGWDIHRAVGENRIRVFQCVRTHLVDVNDRREWINIHSYVRTCITESHACIFLRVLSSRPERGSEKKAISTFERALVRMKAIPSLLLNHCDASVGSTRIGDELDQNACSLLLSFFALRTTFDNGKRMFVREVAPMQVLCPSHCLPLRDTLSRKQWTINETIMRFWVECEQIYYRWERERRHI